MDPGGHHNDAGHAHCLHCVNRHCQFKRLLPAESKSSATSQHPLGCSVTECTLHCGARYHSCKAIEHSLLCPLAKVPCTNREYGCSVAVQRCLLSQHLSICPASAVVCTMEGRWNVLHADQWPAWLLLPSLYGGQEDAEGEKSFWLKHRSGYAFRCGHSLRRDEYSSHFQNVHTEIEAGKDGWLNQRCPLAAYGCSWSFNRFAASASNDRVVFSPIVDGFGITSGLACSAFPAEATSRGGELCGSTAVLEHVHLARTYPALSNHVDEQLVDSHVDSAQYSAATYEQGGPCFQQPDPLTGLPGELLCSILLYLDTFSLNNVSLTCKVLRNACHQLLDRRGIVSVVWKRVAVASERPTWQCASYVWTFSKHFAAVKRWHFVTDTAWINHLAMCPFNLRHRCDHTDLAKHKMFPVDSDCKLKTVSQLSKRDGTREAECWYESDGTEYLAALISLGLADE